MSPTSGMRAVLYARVSTDRQSDEGHSLGAQRARMEAYATEQGLDVVAVIEDGGETGRTLDRPGFRAVMAIVERGDVDVLVSTKADRIARSLRHLLNLVADLDEHRVDLAFTDEDFDTGTPADKLMVQVRGAVAEHELELIRQRTREAMAHARERGVRIGRPPLGYSVVDGKLTPNERYPVVEQAHKLHAAGARLQDIADHLNTEGVPTGSGRGRWQPGNVARLLRSPLAA